MKVWLEPTNSPQSWSCARRSRCRDDGVKPGGGRSYALPSSAPPCFVCRPGRGSRPALSALGCVSLAGGAGDATSAEPRIPLRTRPARERRCRPRPVGRRPACAVTPAAAPLRTTCRCPTPSICTDGPSQPSTRVGERFRSTRSFDSVQDLGPTGGRLLLLNRESAAGADGRCRNAPTQRKSAGSSSSNAGVPPSGS